MSPASVFRHLKIPPRARLIWFGLTEQDFIDLWEAQHGRCFICEKPFNPGRPACIDHDHRTWTVRGLLCSPCNQDIGYKADKERWFRRAGLYLRRPPASTIFDTPRRLESAPPLERI